MSKHGEEQMQRPRGRKELHRVRVQKKGHCGWDIVNKGESGRGQTTKGLQGHGKEPGFSPDCTGDSDCKQENIVRPVLF